MSEAQDLDPTDTPVRGGAPESAASVPSTNDASSRGPALRAYQRPLRVCVVSSEFLGLFCNGGIGTAYTRLATLLAEAGHEVTLLYTNGQRTFSHPIEHWVRDFRNRGLRLVPLPECPVRVFSFSANLAISYRVYLWLREHDDFDVVHFPEYLGHGYYALAACRQGLLLRHATTVVGLHASNAWARVANDRLAASEAELEEDFLEQRSAELADIVWSPGQYMLDWVRTRGWDIGGLTHVQPYVVPGTGVSRRSSAAAPRTVREIVFFGRLEVRKGLLLFLAAVDRLARGSGGLLDIRVSFLGKPTAINGQDAEAIVRERCRDWPFEVRILPDFDEREAMEYLRGEGRLAVVPSLIENYPNTVLECLSHGIPFLASRVGGIPEQIAVEDQDRVCVAPEAGALAARLLEVVRGGQAPARLAFDPRENDREWVRWHEQLAGQADRLRVAPSKEPAISVCIVHHARPTYLRQALRSIAEQALAPVEVIVVDDGSPGNVQGELDRIEAEFDFAARGWRLLRQENRYLGAARNRAAREARGEYLLFMDDDNVAKPHEIATFATAACHSGADVLTCLMDIFKGPVPPWFHNHPEPRCLFPGAVLGLSVLHNTFGDANALYRRAAFLEVGGFTEDYGVGHEDWELFARMMLRGYRTAVVPEALFWYRESPTSMVRTTSSRANYARSLRPHLENVPACYHPLIEMALGQSIKRFSSGASLEGAQPPLALRYRLIDALNARMKRIPLVHWAIKKSIHLALRARRAVAELRRRGGSALDRKSTAPAEYGPNLVAHEGSSTRGPMDRRGVTVGKGKGA